MAKIPLTYAQLTALRDWCIGEKMWHIADCVDVVIGSLVAEHATMVAEEPQTYAIEKASEAIPMASER